MNYKITLSALDDSGLTKVLEELDAELSNFKQKKI